MNRSALRSVVLAPFLVAAVACGGSGDERTAPSSGAPDGGAVTEGGPSNGQGGDGGGPVDGGSAPTIDVHGTVTSYADVPIVGRAVRVVDAHGKHAHAITDSAGHFAVLGVSTPYDVRVSPEGLTDEATVYLGVADVAPYVHGEAAIAPTFAIQKFNVTILMATACEGCGVQYVSKSPHGYGSIEASFPAGSSVANAVLQHIFVSDGSTEPVTLHVLVYDAARTWFRYAEATLTAVAGRTSSGGLFTPDLVPSHALTASVQATLVPANWRPDVAALVMFPDGTSMQTSDTRNMPSLTANVPVIPGAGLGASAVLADPVGDSDPTVNQDVQTWTGAVPSSSASVVLSPTAPLHDVVPAPRSTISRTGPGISWTAAPSTVTEVSLYDTTHKRAVAVVYTDGNAITWARLDSLGVAADPGEYSFNSSKTPDCDIAGLVAGDAMNRKVVDRSVAGSTGYQRWPFTLTP